MFSYFIYIVLLFFYSTIMNCSKIIKFENSNINIMKYLPNSITATVCRRNVIVVGGTGGCAAGWVWIVCVLACIPHTASFAQN